MDSLSSLDNMVDRSPEGRLEIAGPPLRYMHKCNWKMLVENQTDTCHPMVAHQSSVFIFNEIAKLAIFFITNRCFKTNRLFGDFKNLAYLIQWHRQLLSQLFWGRLPTDFVQHMA